MGRVNVFIEDQQALRKLGTHVPLRTVRIQGLGMTLGVEDAEGSQVTRPLGREVKFLSGLFKDTSSAGGSGYFHGDRATFLRGIGMGQGPIMVSFKTPIPTARERLNAEIHADALDEEGLLNLIGTTLFYRNFIVKAQTFLDIYDKVEKVFSALTPTERSQALPAEVTQDVAVIRRMMQSAQKFLFDLGEGLIGIYGASPGATSEEAIGTAVRLWDIRTVAHSRLNTKYGLDVIEEQISGFEENTGKPIIQFAKFGAPVQIRKGSVTFDEGARTTLAQDLDAITKTASYFSSLSANLAKSLSEHQSEPEPSLAASVAGTVVVALIEKGPTFAISPVFGRAPSEVQKEFFDELAVEVAQRRNLETQAQMKGLSLGSNGKIGIFKRAFNFITGAGSKAVEGIRWDATRKRWIETATGKIVSASKVKQLQAVDTLALKAADVGAVSLKQAASQTLAPFVRVSAFMGGLALVKFSFDVLRKGIGPSLLGLWGGLFGGGGASGDKPAGEGDGSFTTGLVVAGLLVVGGIVLASYLSD